MDGNRASCEGGKCSLEDDEGEEPSPYVSDTEDVDIDGFVKSLPHDVNQWDIYKAENFNLEKIGDGFFGEIYKVAETKTNKVMVMKMMKKTGKMKLMCAEIRLMSRLNHPNILKFLGVCIDSIGIHLLTAYMDVGNLEEVVVDAKEPLPWALRMKLAHDISKGMAYLHAVGVIHRDLASKNILISNENGRYHAVVGDFGLAAKIPSRKKKLNVVGSPYWMAPEVLRHDQYNETVDIFSYGIILCEIIGRVHSCPEELPRTNQYGLDVDKFRELVEGCPPEFLQLAVCCCQVDPQSRPPFEVTAKFLAYIRQLNIADGSPAKLKQDWLLGHQRMSANIEDWISDSKKGPEPSLPLCTVPCVCEDGTSAVVTNGTHEKEKTAGEEKPAGHTTPCRRGHSHKRNSFFSGIRYKYFKPSVETEDLVKNTPSKLAGFFNRVLHVQKKHKFDSRKKRSKSSNDTVDAGDRPKLRSFRLFGSPVKVRSGSDVCSAVNVHFDETEEGAIGSTIARPGDNHTSSLTTALSERKQSEPHLDYSSELPYVMVSRLSSGTSKSGSRNSSMASSCATDDRLSAVISPAVSPAISPVPSDEVDFAGTIGSCETDNPLVMSWPHASLRLTTDISRSVDMNGFHDAESHIPRCHSESDMASHGEVTSLKTRTFSTRQYSKQTKSKKYWNFLNFFQKRGKEKHNT